MKKNDIFKSALALIGVSDSDAQRLIASEEAEVEFTMPEGTFYTSTELSSRDEVIRREAKTAGLEVAVKNFKRENGYDFEGKKLETLVAEAQKKAVAEAKVDPDKKVQELTIQNEALRAQVEGFDTTKAELEGKLNAQKLNYQFDTAVNSGLSDVTLKDGWTPGYVSQIFRSDYEPVFEDGKMILKSRTTGETVRNEKTQLPEEPGNVLKSFVNEKGLAGEKSRGGRGAQKPGKGSKFSDVNNLEDYRAYCAEHNINPQGMEGEKLLNTIAAENKNFKAE